MKVNHLRMFLNALRTAIIIVSGFIAYEILLEIEIIWNKKNPTNKSYHLIHRHLYKLIIIFAIDLLLLYFIFYNFKIEL
jgi:uncharacterized membrane protein YidH (DUF202 family)